MGYLLLTLGLSVPWLGGYYWLCALENRLTSDQAAHPARQIGYGFLLGYAGLQAIITCVSTVLGAVAFLPVFALLTAFAIAGFLLARQSFPARKGIRQIPVGGHRNWQRFFFWVLFLWCLLHLALAMVEIFSRPTYPWDAWLAWIYRAKAWFYSGDISALASPSEWLNNPAIAPYTIAAHDYPVFASVIPMWAAISFGQWSETLVHTPALLCGTAIALGIYGQCREIGLKPALAIIAPYAFLSLPLVGTHLSLGGYADIWMAGFAGLGFVALLRGLVQQSKAQASLGLLLLLLCTLVKNEAIVWLYVAAGTFLLSYLRVRTSALGLTLTFAVLIAAWASGFTYIALPLLGGLGLSEGLIHIPLTGGHKLQVHDVSRAYLDSMFVHGSWNLLWGFMVLVVVAIPSLQNKRLAKVVAAFLIAFSASQLFIFALTEQGIWANTYTAINRLPLHFSPVLIVVALISLASLAASRGTPGPQEQPHPLFLIRSSVLPLAIPASLTALMLSLGLYLHHSFPANGAADLKSLSRTGLQVVMGRGERIADQLKITGLQDGVAIASSGRVTLNAGELSVLSYNIESSSSEQPAFFWRQATRPDDIHMMQLATPGSGIVQLKHQDEWTGAISEVGFAFYGEPWDRATISEFDIAPDSISANIAVLWSNWTLFEPWSQSSINWLKGGGGQTRLTLPLLLSLWSGIAILLVCIVGFRYKTGRGAPVIAGLVCCMLGWLVFDVKWTANQLTQNTRTLEYARVRGDHNYIDAGSDRSIEELIESTRKQVERGGPGRALIIGSDRSQEFEVLRAKYHLLPLAATVDYDSLLVALNSSINNLVVIASNKKEKKPLIEALEQQDRSDGVKSRRVAANRIGVSYFRDSTGDQAP